MSQPHPQERLYPLEPLLGRLLTPFAQFLRRSTAGGMVLVAATLLALLLGNSFLKLPYQDFWHQYLALPPGSWRLDHDLQDWVNDALMAVFFFVVGLELKRELLVGELSHWRNAILPIAAAAGGIRNVLPYLLLGLVLWYFLLGSGVHAAIAGILLAITIPARGNVGPQKLRESLEQNQEVLQHLLAQEKNLDPLVNDRLTAMAVDLGQHGRKLRSPQLRLEHQIIPRVTWGVLPIFAQASAGIDSSTVHRNMLWSPITLGVVLGLVFGKFFGITLGSWLSIRIKLATLPPGVSWQYLLGAAWLGGIGFSMSLFISQLAFSTLTMHEEAKLGILLASLLAALLGLGWLFFATQVQKDVHATR
ncbi:MAG: Na+/H+ antiporter NhaA [Acidithiobacillus sp.]|nr:Na+/H+ antiporter NhaA [Acidithiobacillus sp.]